MEQSEYGRVAATEGWFTVNVRDSAWVRSEYFGDACIFEGGVGFPQIGYTLCVLQPGQPNGMYHREGNQEDFLVLQGECLLIVEGQERRLQAWDFFHSPPGCDHILVGAGDGPCLVFAIGARVNGDETLYVRDETALKHGAGPEQDTPDNKVAYAPFPKWVSGPPESFAGLPFA
ncbi:cupin domain-containing protein [Solirubrobacter phytolaccae]|uniref:Cupin domain-containing protein n=1 Tax=Solirubrobacter phytolaccae TaxID=1404360 RepID=A0A9X3N8K9_9ACTN|nr:cupin domain-containing protein [Solirubrobacter phytolaccae]MDA0181990.1 cupin domain-containing protein [Solirubrobacter phytolaccae]